MELKPDERKWSHEEIENKPGRLGAQIIFNNLIKNDFYMWFIGNLDGNQLYTVTLSNEEKAIVSFTEEYIASNYINRRAIIKQINKNFGPKVVLVSMSIQKINEIMKNNMTASVSMGQDILTQQLIKSPIETVIVNPNDHDFFIPINIPYIIRYCEESQDEESLILSVEDDKNKDLSIYEIDPELKRYVLCPDDMDGSISESNGL